jgi:hypothetical protein
VIQEDILIGEVMITDIILIAVMLPARIMGIINTTIGEGIMDEGDKYLLF